jgi:hypothetical protein
MSDAASEAMIAGEYVLIEVTMWFVSLLGSRVTHTSVDFKG